MAVSAVSSAYAATQVKPVSRSAAPTAQSNSAASTIVVSKVTVTNPDGSTTTIITYADGHTETETTPATGSSRQQASSGGSAPASGSGGDGAGRGQLVNLLA